MNERFIVVLVLFSVHTIFSKITIQPNFSTQTLFSTIRTKNKNTKKQLLEEPIYHCSGHIKAESYTDTRQTTAIPEEDLPNLYPYFPLDRKLDSTGQDINSIGQTQLDTFDARMRAGVSNIKINHAKLDALFEANFFAIDLTIPNILFLRHAYMNLQWDHSTLIVGQTNHPIAFPIPNTINYNGFLPFDFYARSMQCTYNYHVTSYLDLIFSLNSEINFQNTGPRGVTGEVFDIRFTQRGIIPNIHFQTRFNHNIYTIGASIDYNRIVPQIRTQKNYSTSEALNSIAGTTYFLIEREGFFMHNKLVIGQNPVQYGSIGGYAIKKDSIDPATDKRSYTNLSTIGLWTDMATQMNQHIQPGIFAGFEKRLGASSKIELNGTGRTTIFGFATNVALTFRVSPRIIIEVGSMNFGIEMEYTQAYYGINNEDGQVINTHPVVNVRTIFASYYFF